MKSRCQLKGWKVKWSNPQILQLLPPNMRMLLKCISGVVENLRISISGSCVHRVCIFFGQKTSQEEWHSPPFYLHPRGYKMCIRVDANGYSNGKGTHVSVFVFFMRGKNDDNLSWPFRGEVTVTLLNQLKDKNHHANTATYAEGSATGANRRVIHCSMGPKGYGWSRFISHDRLGYDVWHNRQYLKDDCLYFQITAIPHWLICTT